MKSDKLSNDSRPIWLSKPIISRKESIERFYVFPV